MFLDMSCGLVVEEIKPKTNYAAHNMKVDLD